MASLTGNLVAETYKALLKTIDNDILTASEKQITDGFGGGSNVFIDSNGFLRANKYKVTNGLATQFLKADGSLDANTYLTSITGAQVITALGYTPVTNARTLTINGTTYDLTANRSWTIAGTSAVWGNITGTLSNQTDLQTALNAKFNNPTGTISQYIRGDGSLATFPTLPGGLPIGGTAGQILAKIDATDYNTHWIDNFATQTKNEVKLGQTLAKGTAVYVSSANGTNMIVSAASNASENLSSKTFGLLETGGATNDFVKCVTFGLLAGLDTSTAQAGDPVWLGVNGALLFGVANKPVAPANMVYIGVVTRVQQNNGEIFVNVQNGFEIEELHDVLITSKANNQGLFYESSTGLWKNKSIATVLGYTPQAQLNGTGFVKASGTTISYDNSTYLTTTDAASTYQRLDRMAINLLASDIQYPNNNAVIAALALKANAANPVFTGNMTISGAEPKLFFTDTDNNPDYTVFIDSGVFYIYDQTAGTTRFSISSTGNISSGVGKSITAGSFVKESGTAAQFLKADGSIDSNTYVTSTALADYLLITTAASTYQRLDRIASSLFASATNYPNNNAVIAGLALKADAANPVFTGSMNIQGLESRINFYDENNLRKFFIGYSSGQLSIYQDAGSATRFQINSSGVISIPGRIVFGSSIDNRPQLPGGFIGIDTGDSNFDIWGISRDFYPSNPTTANAWGIRWNGTNNDLEFVGAGTNRLIVDLDNGAITGGSFVKSGGTGSQYLMADGSVSTLSGLITGSGTANRITKFTGTSTVGNSLLYDDGTNIGIGGFAANWGAGTEGVIQTKNASIYGYSGYEAGIVANAYYNTNWYRIGANTASMIIMNQNINFRVAATGTAGSAITWIEALGIENTGAASFIGKVTSRNATTSAGLSSSLTFIGAGEFMSTGAQSGFFWENRSGGVTSGSNWYGWYTTNGEIKLWNGSTNILSIVGTSGTTVFSGDVLVGTNSSSYTSTGRGLVVANGSTNALFGWSVAGISKGYLYHEGTNAYLENSVSGGSFNIVQVGNGTTQFINNGSTRLTINGSGQIIANNSGQFRITSYGNYRLNNDSDGLMGYLIRSGAWKGNTENNIALATDGPYGISFFTNGTTTEKFHISSGGDFGFNTTSMTYKYNFVGGSMYIPGGQSGASSAAYTSWNQLVFADQFSDVARGPNKIVTYGRGTGWVAGIGIHNDTQAYYAGGTHKFYKFDGTTATLNMSIDGSGNISATAFFESSDFRLKKLIENNPIIKGIEKLKAKLYEKNGKIEIGYFAQDAEKLMPYAVTKNEDGFLNLSYREVHTAKIQFLERKVKELETKLDQYGISI